VQSFGNVNAEVGAAGPVRRRSLYFARNNCWAANAVSAIVTNTIGAGIRPASRHPDPDVRAAIQERFERWTYEADLDGVTDHYGQQQLAVRSMIEAGEGFARLIQTPMGLKVQLLDPEMCPTDETRELGDGRRVIQGVEYSAEGERVAYWIHRVRPELPSFSTDLIRVPAAEMVHLFQPLMPGQVRGVAWLAPILLRLHECDIFEDAAIVKQKISALLCGYITDVNGTAGGFQPEGTQTGSLLNVAMEPGTIRVLPPGADIRFSEPADVGDGVAFLKFQLHAISAGLGVPQHLVSNDVSSANYSSLRAALLEFHARVEQWQFSVVIPQLCRRVWHAWVLNEVLAGRLPGTFEELSNVEFIPPGLAWVDPEKDAKAAAEQLAAGLTSRRKLVAALGYDVEELDREIAADRAREKALGLQFGDPAPTAPAPVRRVDRAA
jgi:lambda family phage portal protein